MHLYTEIGNYINLLNMLISRHDKKNDPDLEISRTHFS